MLARERKEDELAFVRLQRGNRGVQVRELYA
jgi:hypothetical protein